MQTFTDAAGREWLVRLTVGKIGEVFERTGLSIYELVSGGAAGVDEFLDNGPLLANVVFILCRAQARRMRVTPESFCAAITSLEDMQEAFVKAVIRFYPVPDRKRREKAEPKEDDGEREHDRWERAIFEVAGIAGLDARRHSLREIQASANGRQAEAWGHTSSLMAQVANLHRDKRKRSTPITPQELNPFLKPRGVEKKEAATVVTTAAAELLSPDKAERFARIVAAKAHAKETGDWSEFRRLTAPGST